jgi:hypothetical protein
MKPFLVIEFRIPLASDGVLEQADTLSTVSTNMKAFVDSLPEGTTRTERIVRAGRVETKPRQRRTSPAPAVQAAAPAARAAE